MYSPPRQPCPPTSVSVPGEYIGGPFQHRVAPDPDPTLGPLMHARPFGLPRPAHRIVGLLSPYLLSSRILSRRPLSRPRRVRVPFPVVAHSKSCLLWTQGALNVHTRRPSIMMLLVDACFSLHFVPLRRSRARASCPPGRLRIASPARSRGVLEVRSRASCPLTAQTLSSPPWVPRPPRTVHRCFDFHARASRRNCPRGFQLSILRSVLASRSSQSRSLASGDYLSKRPVLFPDHSQASSRPSS